MLKVKKFYQQRFPALSYRDFNIMWVALTLSAIGTQMQIVAVNWQIYILTHSAIALGTIGLIRFVAVCFFALPAGISADKYNRKIILIVTQVIFAILSFILAITTANNTISVTLIYIVSACSSIIFAFDTPARQSFYPQLVKKEHFPNATSINFIGWQVALVLGPALGGFVIGQFGIAPIYFLNAISFFAVIVGLFIVSTKGHVEGEKQSFSFASIKEGINFALHRQILWSTMLLDFVSTFFSSATALLPIFAKDVLAVGPFGLGLLYAAPSIGALIAGFVLAHVGKLKAQGKILLSGVVFYALGTVLFGISRNFMLSLFFLTIVGAGDSISTIIRNTIRQLQTPDNMRGRMTAINMIFFMGGPQLGEFEAGVTAAALGGPTSVVIGGVGTLIAVGVMTYLLPKLRNYEGS